MNHKNHLLAYVSVEGSDREIVIEDLLDRNRALHGDVVAVRLYAKRDTNGLAGLDLKVRFA